jgi:hypothetical protein
MSEGTVRYLIEEHEADVYVWADAALRMAAQYGHDDVVEYLESQM